MKKVILFLQRAEEIVGGGCLCIFFGTVLIQMFSRYLSISMTWTGEVCTYAFMVSVFFGASAIVYNRQHFAFTALIEKVEGNKKNVISLFISAIMLCFNGAMCYYGMLITQKYWHYTWTTIPSFKKGPVFLCMPLSAGLAILFLIALMMEDVEKIRRRKIEDKKEGSN